MSPCLADDDVLAFALGQLRGAAAARVIEHLDACDVCRAVVAAAAPTAPSAATDADTPAQAPGDAGLAVGARVGRFVVVGPVGKGGMGEVHAAFDPDLNRKVALKLVRPDLRGDTLEERLVREAQALARLSHPDVITVYEVGAVDDRVFLAMEFMDGGTLRDWLRAAPRPWGEIVDRFVRAGEGLRAAHEAGLVHRDFKPDNVLLARDGRQRVTDFGLARAVWSDVERARSAPAAARVGSPLDTSLTSDGALLGTPAYIAPEQLRGQADARADQFSFCASLYQALYGALPFAGADLDAYVAAIRAGEVRPAPRGTAVPPALRAALVRGLAFEPDARFPSMRALLDALRATRRRRRWPWLVAGAAALIAAGAATQAWVTHAPPACAGADRRLAGVWDAARRRDVRAAFAATRAPFADGAWTSTAATLDAWGDGWVRRRTDACEDTQVRHEEPAAVMELRYACLDGRLEAARALVERLAHADAPLVERAPHVAASLPDLARCDDVPALARRVAYRDDAQARAAQAIDRDVAAALAQWIADHERADALGAPVGEREPALAALRAAVARARAVDYAPTLAEAAYELGAALVDAGEPRDAEPLLIEASTAAVRGRDDEAAERAWTRLATVAAEGTHHADDADRWLRYAQAVEAGRGRPPDATSSELLAADARVALARGELARGEQAFRRQLALESALPHRDAQVRDAIGNVAIALSLEGRLDEGYPLFQRVLASDRAQLGPLHPDTVTAEEDTGYALVLLHRDDEALPLLEAATRARAQLAAERSTDVATDQSRTAQALAGLGRLDDAAALAHQALATLEALLGPDEPAMFDIVQHVGEIELARGHVDDARAALERADAMAVRGGASPVELAPVELSLARALVAAHGDHARAIALAEHARAIYADLARQWGGANVASAAAAQRWLDGNR